MRTEQLIFSQLLINEQFARKVLQHVKAEYFSDEADKNFFKIYSRYFTKHSGIPSKQAMRMEIENLKGSQVIYNSLLEVINSTEVFNENLDYLVQETEKFCKNQAIFNALKESILIVDAQADPKNKKSVDIIPSILQSALAVCFDTTVGHNYIEESNERYEYYHTIDAKIPTGSPEFDKITKGGFSRKTLNLILAPPHGGKSLVMVNMGCGALLAGFNVLMITMEMSEFEMSKRFDVNLMNVTFDELHELPKAIFSNKFSQVVKASKGKLIVKEFPTGAAHAGNFRALLEELKTKQNFTPDLIIVDYLGIIGSERYKGNTNVNSYTTVKSAAEELRALGIESNCAVISAIQTNRQGLENSSIGMSEISESMGPAHIADFISAVINTEDLKNLKQMMFKIIKNRYAGIAENDKFVLNVDYNRMKLHSLENSFAAGTKSFTPKKKSFVETANDTFDLDVTPVKKSNYDDFNF